MKFFRKYEINKLNKTQLFLSLLLIASPWIVLFITTQLFAHHSVYNSVPCWSDELSNWHEVLSFSQKGFNFGHYSVNEALPHCLSFGTHGFGAVSIYALFGQIFGWKFYSIVIANTFFVSISFLILILLVKISTKNIWQILLFSLTYAPFILFSPTSMTELLNFSLLIIYFGLLHKYFESGRKEWLITLLLFCLSISFVRIIYILLFLPVLFKIKTEFKFDIKFLVSIVLWIVFGGLLFMLNNLFVSPYPDSFLNDLLKSAGFTEFVTNFVHHFVQNTWNFINPVSENLIQVLQRYFVIFISLCCLFKSGIVQSKFKRIETGYFIVFLILFLFLLINITAYDVFDWRDYRVLAPVLYGCVLFLILNDKRIISYSSLAFNLAGILFLMISPQVLESFNNGRYIQPVQNSVLNRIEYTIHPESRFENTVVVNQFNINTVLNIPAGIGISYSEVLSDKLKSRFLYSNNKLNLSTYKLIDSNKTGYLYKKILTNR